jgi:very-short-patch-repair endonuclease
MEVDADITAGVRADRRRDERMRRRGYRVGRVEAMQVLGTSRQWCTPCSEWSLN